MPCEPNMARSCRIPVETTIRSNTYILLGPIEIILETGLAPQRSGHCLLTELVVEICDVKKKHPSGPRPEVETREEWAQDWAQSEVLD